METCSWDVVGHKRIRPIGVVLAESLRIACGTQMDRAGPDHRKLGTSPLLQDRKRHLLHVASTTLPARRCEVTVPRVTTDLTGENNHIIPA